jgi:putative transposase
MPKVLSTEKKNEALAKEGKILRHYGVVLRAYPNSEEVEKLNKTIGCARFVSNFYLSERQEVFKNTGKTLDVDTFKKAVVQLKKHPEFLWLAKVDKFALENAIYNVNDAYVRFFKGLSKFPRFKSKRKSEQSYTTEFTGGNIRIDFEKETVTLPKVGDVKVALSNKQKRGLAGRILSATIKRSSAGQWHISIAMEEVVPLQPKLEFEDIDQDKIRANDLGLTHFMIDDTGKKVENPRYYRKQLSRLAKMQRKLSKMVKGSNNWNEQKKKIAKLHKHIANMRKDFLHKESRKLVDENQVIILEDLNVKNMIKNRKLAKSIQDVGWGTFKQFVTYKANWAGKIIIFIDQFYPSSKLCNGCNEKHTMLTLNDREWICPNCGAIHDRDVNAAKNLKKEGIRLLKVILDAPDAA